MAGSLKVLHTANAGVVIRTEAGGIGIDLFSRDPEGQYEDTPKELKARLLGDIKKERITALVFTHGHGDHFCLETAAEALGCNPDLPVISTEEVIGRLKEAVPEAGSLWAVEARERENRGFALPGGSLEVFNSRHMGEQYAEVQNLACLLEIGGKRIAVPGDAAPTKELFLRIGRISRKLDLMIGPFPLFGIPTNRKMISESLEVSEILAVHLPRPQADEQNWTESAKKVCGRARDGLPMPVFAEKPGREYVFGGKMSCFTAASQKKP